MMGSTRLFITMWKSESGFAYPENCYKTLKTARKNPPWVNNDGERFIYELELNQIPGWELKDICTRHEFEEK